MSNPASAVYDILVLGAGISGLVVARQSALAGCSVLLVEKSKQVGGVIHTEQVDGFLLENGPNSFVSHPPRVMDFLLEVGLKEQTMQTPMRENDRYIWHGGKLRKVPGSPPQLLFSDCLPATAKMRAIAGLFKHFDSPVDDISLGEFFRSVLGDVAVERLLKPALSGIYAANADRVSLQATLPRIFQAVQQEQKMVRAMKRLKSDGPRPAPKNMVSFQKGLQELPEAVAEDFQKRGGSLRLGADCELVGNEDGVWRVRVDQKEVLARKIVCTVSAPNAAQLLKEQWPDASNELEQLPYAALSIIHIGADEQQFREQRQGFGFLSVRDQQVDALGMIWSDRIFSNRAPQGKRLLTGIYGGEIQPEAAQWSDEELLSRVRKDLKRSMGFDDGAFELCHIKRHSHALPIFNVGHMDKIESIEKKTPERFTFFANYTGGISLADRIVRGIDLAEKLVKEEREK